MAPHSEIRREFRNRSDIEARHTSKSLLSVGSLSLPQNSHASKTAIAEGGFPGLTPGGYTRRKRGSSNRIEPRSGCVE